MNKKKYFLSLLLLGLILCGCGAKTSGEVVEPTESESTENAEQSDYPMIAYIDNENYYGTGEICEAVPRKTPDGTIETFVDKEIMPDAYNSANFGSEYEKLEYMFLEDGQLIIHIGEDWIYFEK